MTDYTKPDTTGDIRYPFVSVRLVGSDGNAFAIMGAVCKNLRRGLVSPEEVQTYQKEAMSGDYDHLLQTTMRWVDVS